MAQSDTRSAILDAAYRVVARDGADALTLDAVAREAGVSKGGLLYHYRGKDALIAGLIARYVEEFEAAIEAHLDPADDAPGRWLRAYVNASFAADPVGLDETAGLLAAAAVNPGLLDPIRARDAAWQARAEADGIDPTRATIVRLAVDGLDLAGLFGLATPTGEARERLRGALLALTREPTDHPPV